MLQPLTRMMLATGQGGASNPGLRLPHNVHSFFEGSLFFSIVVVELSMFSSNVNNNKNNNDCHGVRLKSAAPICMHCNFLIHWYWMYLATLPSEFTTNRVVVACSWTCICQFGQDSPTMSLVLKEMWAESLDTYIRFCWCLLVCLLPTAQQGVTKFWWVFMRP